MTKGKLYEVMEVVKSTKHTYLIGTQLEKILDAAKKEFPKPDQYEWRPGVEIDEYDTDDIKKWFKRWLGDSEDE